MWKIPPIRIPNIFTECGCWLWSIIRAAYFVQSLFLCLSPLSSYFSPCLCDVRGYRGQMCQGSIKGWCLHLGSKSSHHSTIQGWYVQAWNSLAASVPFSSVAQSCPTFCDLVNRSTPGLPVHYQLPESTQTHVHQADDAIQSSHPLSSPSPPALNLSQH